MNAMKKLMLLFLGLSLAVQGWSQKYLPEIKNGTALLAQVYTQGVELPLLLTVKNMTAPVNLEWYVEGFGDGNFEMSEAALENGSAIFAGQPSRGLTRLSDKETFGLISKGAFKSLTDNGSFTYNQLTFRKKEQPATMQLGDKILDVVHVVSEDGKVQLWVLNRPEFPVLMQTLGFQIDLVVTAIQ